MVDANDLRMDESMKCAVCGSSRTEGYEEKGTTSFDCGSMFFKCNGEEWFANVCRKPKSAVKVNSKEWPIKLGEA